MWAKTTSTQGADSARASGYVMEGDGDAPTATKDASRRNRSGEDGYRLEWNPEAVRRLEEDLKWARASNPGGPAEVAGLLLGKLDSGIEIVAFEPVLLTSDQDHAYALNGPGKREFERKIEAFRTAAQPELSVVGFYRSQIGDEFELTGHDLGLIRTCFRRTRQIGLLVKLAGERVSGAKLFAGVDGQLLAEFQLPEEAAASPVPFELWRSLTEDRPADVPVAPETVRHPEIPAQEATPQPQTIQLVETHVANRPSRRGRLLLLPATFFVCILATYAIFTGAAGLRHGTDNSQAASGLPVSVAQSRSGLDLRAERQGDALRIDWNHSAPLLAAATRGILTVREGNAEEKQVTLDANLLRTGAVLYRPVHGQVFLRIIVFGQSGTKLGESTRLVRDGEGS